MLGESVTIYRRTQAGADSMGEPLYVWSAETVDNCLVNVTSGSDQADEVRPDGIRSSCTVALPKAYTKGKPVGYLDHARVSLTGRGMADDAETALSVSGSPMRTSPCPTAWDTKLVCGRMEG